jgi:hypothetical protein
MRNVPCLGRVLTLALAFGAAACSGNDDQPGDTTAGSSNGSAGSGGSRTGSPAGGGSGVRDGVTAIGEDGTEYFGNFPVFPGAGTSDQAKPLENGMICDSVPGKDLLIADPIRQCFFDKDDPNHTRPAATFEQVLECAEQGDLVHIRLTFHPWFVDNTYGETQIGWVQDDEAADAMMMMRKPGKRGKGHTFGELVGSDHAEIKVSDGSGTTVLHFKLDYISADPSAASGYASLGVTGAEGKMIVGDASAIVQWMTSLDRNLNERGYASYTTDSPATDELYSPNPDTPEWDYRVVYEAWIDADVFGDAGFGGATIEFVHASLSKAASNTIVVEPGDCPPPDCVGSDPDADCFPGDVPPPGQAGAGGSGGSGGSGEPLDPCADNDPDTVCTDGSGGNGGDPSHCTEHPEDPSCIVD